MASSLLPKPATQVKRLGELLQEKQEPFLLDVYLLERGYSKETLKLDGNNTSACSPPAGNSSGKDLKRLGANYDYSKRRKRSNPHYPKILRSVLNKLTSVYDSNRKSSTTNCTSISKMSCERDCQVAELGRFSSASSMTVFESCSSESDGEEFSHQSFLENPISSSSSADAHKSLQLHNLLDQEATTGRTNQWGCMEDTSKQHSPVSVLEEFLPFYEVQSSSRNTSYKNKIRSSSSSFILPKKITDHDDQSILSASLWKLLLHALIEKQGCSAGILTEIVLQEELLNLGTANSSSQYLKTKRVLEQTKQLMFDCVREAVDQNHHGRNKKGRRSSSVDHEMLGGEDVGKIICEQICLWGKQSGNITNITQLISSDFCVSTEEWSETQPQIRENIGIEIGDAIFEELKNEIVTDMIEYYFDLNR